MKRLLTLFTLSLCYLVGLMQAYAVPVEQDFDGITFIKIDTQSFIFGSSPDQANYQASEYPKVVPFSHIFWMGKYEITQSQWATVMGSNPSTFISADGPVETITWQQAKDFVAALNQQAGANHYRLPTEAEWEYVAKAGQYTQWSFGDNIGDLATYTYRDSVYAPRVVGQRQSNAWGVYDLYGNVYEWTEDWYQYSLPSDFGGCPPSTGTYKVIRGGSNACNSLYLRSASRQFAHPDRKAYSIGLRIVRVDDPTLDLYQPDTACTIDPFCGDGYVNAAEECDDGNVNDGDGCSAVCIDETDTDNDGVVDAADAFPNDPTETTDTDGDGVGDNTDEVPNHADFTSFDYVSGNSDALAQSLVFSTSDDEAGYEGSTALASGFTTTASDNWSSSKRSMYNWYGVSSLSSTTLTDGTAINGEYIQISNSTSTAVSLYELLVFEPLASPYHDLFNYYARTAYLVGSNDDTALNANSDDHVWVLLSDTLSVSNDGSSLSISGVPDTYVKIVNDTGYFYKYYRFVINETGPNPYRTGAAGIAFTEIEDADGDGVGDAADTFPSNPSESADTDGDGIGNNADNAVNVYNPDQTDTDSDGVGDVADAFPNDSTETTDTDGDGVGDNTDEVPNHADFTSFDYVSGNADAFAQSLVFSTSDDEAGYEGSTALASGFTTTASDNWSSSKRSMYNWYGVSSLSSTTLTDGTAINGEYIQISNSTSTPVSLNKLLVFEPLASPYHDLFNYYARTAYLVGSNDNTALNADSSDHVWVLLSDTLSVSNDGSSLSIPGAPDTYVKIINDSGQAYKYYRFVINETGANPYRTGAAGVAFVQ